MMTFFIVLVAIFAAMASLATLLRSRTDERGVLAATIGISAFVGLIGGVACMVLGPVPTSPAQTLVIGASVGVILTSVLRLAKQSAWRAAWSVVVAATGKVQDLVSLLLVVAAILFVVMTVVRVLAGFV